MPCIGHALRGIGVGCKPSRIALPWIANVRGNVVVDARAECRRLGSSLCSRALCRADHALFCVLTTRFFPVYPYIRPGTSVTCPCECAVFVRTVLSFAKGCRVRMSSRADGCRAERWPVRREALGADTGAVWGTGTDRVRFSRSGPSWRSRGVPGLGLLSVSPLPRTRLAAGLLHAVALVGRRE